MASLKLISLLILFAFLPVPLAARTLKNTENVSSSLLARLMLDEDGSAHNNSCWDSLFQLQSCTGEVILFFLNGETQLGPDCCKAVGLIEEYCWPNMIGSLGFTADQEEVLRGFFENENAGL